ncbi:MAG: MFS transporter, partial [Candidatus Firestonebacteria bacterium]
YYWLTVLYGTRKQIFLTFAPWVLVSVFLQKVQVIAILLLIAGVIGIGFKPLLGYLIDKLGEKIIIVTEGILLIGVCIGYGFSREWFSGTTALYLTFACFIADGLLMSVNMARATYMKKIALNRAELTSTLTMGTTIDHVFSISVALIGGIIWSTSGYKYIFLLGAVIAATSAVSAMFLKIPAKENN